MVYARPSLKLFHINESKMACSNGSGNTIDDADLLPLTMDDGDSFNAGSVGCGSGAGPASGFANSCNDGLANAGKWNGVVTCNAGTTTANYCGNGPSPNA